MIKAARKIEERGRMKKARVCNVMLCYRYKIERVGWYPLEKSWRVEEERGREK